jgi:hypothetical protein
MLWTLRMRRRISRSVANCTPLNLSSPLLPFLLPKGERRGTEEGERYHTRTVCLNSSIAERKALMVSSVSLLSRAMAWPISGWLAAMNR